MPQYSSLFFIFNSSMLNNIIDRMIARLRDLLAAADNAIIDD